MRALPPRTRERKSSFSGMRPLFSHRGINCFRRIGPTSNLCDRIRNSLMNGSEEIHGFSVFSTPYSSLRQHHCSIRTIQGMVESCWKFLDIDSRRSIRITARPTNQREIELAHFVVFDLVVIDDAGSTTIASTPKSFPLSPGSHDYYSTQWWIIRHVDASRILDGLLPSSARC